MCLPRPPGLPGPSAVAGIGHQPNRVTRPTAQRQNLAGMQISHFLYRQISGLQFNSHDDWQMMRKIERKIAPRFFLRFPLLLWRINSLSSWCALLLVFFRVHFFSFSIWQRAGSAVGRDGHFEFFVGR